MIKILKDAKDFEAAVKADKNVLVDFNATWCGPCRMMGREMQELEKEFPNVTFLKVDTDEFPEIAQIFGVISIPDMVAFQDGKRIRVKINGAEEDALVGTLPEDSFRTVLDDTLRFASSSSEIPRDSIMTILLIEDCSFLANLPAFAGPLFAVWFSIA